MPAQTTLWVRMHPLRPIHVDCATTVMLKILDGKCKMSEEEKVVMAELYHAVKHRQGELFDQDLHDFIAQIDYPISDEMKMVIYEKRLMAETMLSRPIMKDFKAMIRAKGLFAGRKVTAA